MSRTTDFLEMHIWDIPADNNQSFDYVRAIADNFEKIDENAESVDTNIQALQAEQTTQSTNIQTLQAENAELKDNTIPGQAEGESIHITDASLIKAKMTLKGKSEQATRSGKNKLKLTPGTLTYQGVTITIAEDGLITLNGTVADGTPAIKITNGLEGTLNLGSKPASWLTEDIGINGTYTLEKIYVSGSTTYTTAPVATTYTEDDTRKDFLAVNGSGVSNSTTNDNLSCLVLYLTSAGTVFTNYKFYLQTEEGTKSQVSDYEQYGAMPSPAYPSTIQNIEGDIEVLFTGKNKTGSLNWTVGTYAYAPIPEEDEVYILSLKPKTTIPSNLYLGFTQFGDYMSPNAMKWIIEGGDFSQYATLNGKGFYYGDNTTYAYGNLNYISVYPASCKNELDTYFDIQLEKANGATIPSDYEEYKSQAVTFPLAEGQKLMEGDYLAEDGVHHVRGKIVLDGSQYVSKFDYNSALSTTDYNCFFFNDNSIKQAPDSMNIYVVADKLIGTPSSQRTSNKLNCWLNHFASKQIGMHVPNTITSTTELQTWLTNNPITFEYIIDEETIDPYTSAQQDAWDALQSLQLFKGENNISSQAIMQLDYTKDTNKVVEDLQEQIDELKQAVISLGGV